MADAATYKVYVRCEPGLLVLGTEHNEVTVPDSGASDGYWPGFLNEPANRQTLGAVLEGILHRPTAQLVLSRLAPITHARRAFATLRGLTVLLDQASPGHPDTALRRTVIEYELRYQEASLGRSVDDFVSLLQWLADETVFADVWSVRGARLENDLARLAWTVPAEGAALGIRLAEKDESWPASLIAWFRERLRPALVWRAWQAVRQALRSGQPWQSELREQQSRGDTWSQARTRHILGAAADAQGKLAGVVRQGYLALLGSLGIGLLGTVAIGALPGLNRSLPGNPLPVAIVWLPFTVLCGLATGVAVTLAPKSWWSRVAAVIVTGGALGAPTALRETLINWAPSAAALSLGLGAANLLVIVIAWAFDHRRPFARGPAGPLLIAAVTALPSALTVSLLAAAKPWEGFRQSWPWLACWFAMQLPLHVWRLSESGEILRKPPPLAKPPST